MLDRIKQELHYNYRSLRLVWGFIAKRFIHCNLQVTFRCNFKCQICDFWKEQHDRNDELSIENFKLISKKLAKLGTIIVSLAGGEPLIREDLYDIITIFAKAKHFPILITNGWYVDDAVAKDILRAGLQEISVSVDYADPEKHDTLRGKKGAWAQAVKALELFNKNRPGRRNRVHMISVLMKDNLEEIEPLIKLSRELGVTYMLSLYSWNRGAKEKRMPDQKVTEHLLDLKRRYPEFVTLTSYIENLDQAIMEGGIGNCQTGRYLLNIDNHGNVARCTEMLDKPVGNILTEDIKEVAKRLRKLQQEQECSQCWTSCRGFVECMNKPPRRRQFKEFFTSVKKY
ncbi:radical SAM/SPASM domain-containing protein [Planctomycetota bacterium]